MFRLFASNPNRVGIESLIVQGVRFDVCMNTMNTIKRDTGQVPVLDPKIDKVDYGVGQIMKLVSEGYVLSRNPTKSTQ